MIYYFVHLIVLQKNLIMCPSFAPKSIFPLPIQTAFSNKLLQSWALTIKNPIYISVCCQQNTKWYEVLFCNLIWLDFQMTLCVVFTIARLVTHSYLMALSSNIFIFLPALLALYRYSFMWYISLSGDIWYISLENNALSRLIGVNTIFL